MKSLKLFDENWRNYALFLLALLKHFWMSLCHVLCVCRVKYSTFLATSSTATTGRAATVCLCSCQTGCESANSEGCYFGQIYTNIHDWYDVPAVLPNIGRSDHRAVVMSPSVNAKRERGPAVTVVRRSQDSNGKALLAQALQNINLTSLYNMQHCEEMVASFYSTVTSLLHYYLPLLSVKRHITDKPWVTD